MLIPVILFVVIACLALLYVAKYYYGRHIEAMELDEREEARVAAIISNLNKDQAAREPIRKPAADGATRIISTDLTDRGKSLVRLRSMDPTAFEHFIARLYRQRGYDATVTARSNDRGVDIILADKKNRTTAVQVKRYREAGNIGAPAIREFVGSFVQKYDEGVFITTSGYTKEAIREAQLQRVQLIDGDGLLRMINGEKFIERPLLGR